MYKSEKQRVGLCNFLFHESEFCTICKQWLHYEHETLRNRSAVSTETYLSPRLTPALHLKLFLLWTKNRKTMNGTFLTQEMAQSFSRSREDDHSKRAIIGINLTFMLLSIAGNLLVIFSVFRTPSLRSPSTTLLCGLAASDVIVGLIAQPLFVIQELIPNDTLKYVVYFFSCNGCGVSLLTMTLISLDRYAALQYHMRYATMVTSKRVICTLATMWFVIYVEFGIYFWKREVFFLLAACFIISCLLLSTFSYVRIYRIVKRHQRQIQVQTQVFQGPNIGSNFNIIRLKRSTINTFIFYIFLILCYSPIFPLMIVDVLLRNQVWCDSLMYATTVIFMNSAINPILYCCVLKDLRKAFLRAARKVFCK